MKATAITELPAGDEWIYEVKWDGYRALAHLHKGTVEIRSRNNKSFNEKFYSIHEALLKQKIITGTSSDANVLRLLPPLCLKREEVDLFVEKLREILPCNRPEKNCAPPLRCDRK